MKMYQIEKKYIFSIVGILLIMLLSVVYYVLKIIQHNNSLSSVNESISYLITGDFDNFKDTEEEFDDQGPVYNYLISENENQKKAIVNSINTSAGFESLFTPNEKMCYNLIKSNCDNISNDLSKTNLYSIEPITVRNCRLAPLQIKKVIYAIQHDNPDIFWISNNFSYQYLGNSTILKLNSIFSKNDQKAAIETLSKKISEIISKVPSNASEYEKELYIHNYIINHCKYNFESNNPKIYTSYGCLVENKAVCEGYSKATQLLLNTIGIECRTVTGAKENEPHMWNIAKINSKWYHLDVTWDSSNEIGNHNYFNLNDEIIKKDHIINEESYGNIAPTDDKRYNFKLPKCNSMSENYYEKNAVKISKIDTAADNLIIKKLINLSSKKEPYFYIKIEGNYENIRNQLISEKPYKLFKYFASSNKSNPKNKLNTSKLDYSENRSQNVLIAKLSYVN